MTLKNLTDNIAIAAKNEKIINYSAAGTSLYQLNPKAIDAYPVLFQSPTGEHLVTDNYTTYELTLYYLDRLTDDNINDIDIYSAAIEELKNLVRKIETIDGVFKVEDGYRITNFADTESFDDRLAGAYTTIQVVTINNWICAVD